MVVEAPLTALDHQVTYGADSNTHHDLLANLDHHRLVTRTLVTSYLDTPDLRLHREGVTLRQRRRASRWRGQRRVRTEAKIPSPSGLRRYAGDEAQAAVVAIAGDASLSPVAVQTKSRKLLLAGGSALAPDFVVALDEAQIEANGATDSRLEVDAQLFTALPWTKAIDDQRLDRFANFCRKLESDHGLRPAELSGYQAIGIDLLRGRVSPCSGR